MTELIHVDFKAKTVTGRRDITPVPVGEWKAAKDPIFKEFVTGLAFAAESFHAIGGDWTKLIIVMADDNALEGPACFTLWDSNIQTNEQVSDALMTACSKVSIDSEGDEDEPV